MKAVPGCNAVRSCFTTGIAGSNPAEDRELVFVVRCVSSGHCDKLITRSEESYRVCFSNCV